MRYWYLHLAVFLGALAVPAWWLYQAWIFALGPDRARPGRSTGAGRLGIAATHPGDDATAEAERLAGLDRRASPVGVVVLHLCAAAPERLLRVHPGVGLGQLGIELSKRPYIIVGMLGFVCLFLLAITSNRFAMRKLGSRWKKLHRLVYLILGLGLLHMLWVVRADLEEWTLYAVAGASLMLLRLPSIARRLPRLRTRHGVS